MSRPTLKITRHGDREPPGDVCFEVWNPITARYEPMEMFSDGLFRLDELAELVWLMWLNNDSAQASLKDAPDPAENDDTEWAELRVTVQPNRVYETQTFYQHEWTTAMSRSAAIQRTCNEVGYSPP